MRRYYQFMIDFRCGSKSFFNTQKKCWKEFLIKIIHDKGNMHNTKGDVQGRRLCTKEKDGAQGGKVDKELAWSLFYSFGPSS